MGWDPGRPAGRAGRRRSLLLLRARQIWPGRLTVVTGVVTLGLAVLLVGHLATGSGSGDDGRPAGCGSTPCRWCSWWRSASSTRPRPIFAVGYMHPAGTRPGAALLPAGSSPAQPVRLGDGHGALVNGLALLWVAIEVTTVVSALLVAIDDTDGATEAAWKYMLIASMGLGIALLATIIMYYAGGQVFGTAYELFYPKLLGGAHHFPADLVRLSFVLAVLGFGTKMGLVPVHTWLPDAHSEAPTPISALLSGVAAGGQLLRHLALLPDRRAGPRARLSPGRAARLRAGLAGLAALYLASQRDLKRLLAYSSVEHMGILAIGMSFSAPLAIVGVLLHVLAHAAAKGTAFFGAGSVLRKLRHQGHGPHPGRRSGSLPWTGPLLVLAVLGLCAMPPLGIFRSEFLIVAGGLSDPRQGGRRRAGGAGHPGLLRAVVLRVPQHPRAHAARRRPVRPAGCRGGARPALDRGRHGPRPGRLGPARRPPARPARQPVHHAPPTSWGSGRDVSRSATTSRSPRRSWPPPWLARSARRALRRPGGLRGRGGTAPACGRSWPSATGWSPSRRWWPPARTGSRP